MDDNIKIIGGIMMRLLKQLLCKHNYSWYRNIWGDEIITANFKRAIYKCEKCGKNKFI